MKTRQRGFTVRRLYSIGCVLALLGMAATATALDKSSGKKPTSGKTASGTSTKTATKIAASSRAEREERRRRRAQVAAREAMKRAEERLTALEEEVKVSRMLERMKVASGGFYFPYSSYRPRSSGTLVVDAAKAELKTDPEQERDLVRADEFARQGKFELAIGFWQRVLDAANASVMTRDEWKFHGSKHTFQKFSSIADEVERSIARLPKRGLKAYRLLKDGDAQAVLAAGKGPRREEALSNVVRKYFLSSFGDDAAFELACRSMDRGEFIAAARLLEKVLSGYPDPSVSRKEILLRLAVAHSRLGDRKAAEAALAELRKDPPRGSRRLLAVIEADVRSAGQFVSADATDSSTSWPMSLGGATRTGHMKAPAGLKSIANLSEFWSREIDLGLEKRPGKTTPSRPARGMFPGASSDGVSHTMMVGESMGGSITSYTLTSPAYPGRGPAGRSAVPAARGIAELIARWKQLGWMPAGQLLLDGRRMYLKTRTNLICLDAETNKLLWKSVSTNEFEPDGMTQKYAQLRLLQSAGLPQQRLDVQLFGDRIHQSMSLAGELVLSIEGKPSDGPTASAGSRPSASRIVPTPYYYGPQVVHRKRSNYLTAFEARTGKLRWTRPAGDGPKDESGSEAGFLAAPVPYARLLLAPVINSGEVWLYALDRETGKTVWKTNLCEEPSNGAAPWSPVGVAIDGGEAYVATGAGVVFAVDAMSGRVRWAVRYPRTGRANHSIPRSGYYGGGAQTQILDIEGMDEDVVIPSGKTLVVMASDYDRIFAVDRRSGEFLWDTPLSPKHDEDPGKQPVAEKQADMARYCLGVLGDAFYVGSNRAVRKYKIRGGSLAWEKTLQNTTGDTPPSLGRGIVTDEAVFVPVMDSVLKLSHADGKELDQFGVVLSDHQPVGNLYSDGQRLFVLGPNRVSALGDLKVRLRVLDERIKNGDLDALLERMDVRGRTGEFNGALEDLQRVTARMKREKRAGDIPPLLLKAVAGMNLPARDPIATLRVLAANLDAFAVVPGVDEREAKARIRARNVLVRTALLRLLKERRPGFVAAVLQGGELYGPADLLDVARQAVRKQATGDDLNALTAAMAGPPSVRRLAVIGLSRLKQKSVNVVLKKALADPDEMVRLESAVVLCNRGDRESLAAMAELLTSDNLSTRRRTASYLRRMTGKTFGYLAYETARRRAEAVRKWRQWVKTEGETATLRPVSPVRVFFGRTLIANNGNNFVDEYDPSGRRTQHLRIDRPTAVQGLPNGHRLIATMAEKAVIEYDEHWKEVARISTAKYGAPYSVQRLDDGNTLVACYDTGQSLSPRIHGNVLVFNPAGEIKWRFQYGGEITHAQRLENGNTLVTVHKTYSASGRRPTFRGGKPLRSPATSRTYRTVTGPGKVLEVDPDRKIIRQIRTVFRPWSARRLANGNTLIADREGSQVVEVDPRGKTVWKKTRVSQPLLAQRLANGHTLVTRNGGVTEFDSRGSQVWGRVGSSIFAAHRY